MKNVKEKSTQPINSWIVDLISFEEVRGEGRRRKEQVYGMCGNERRKNEGKRRKIPDESAFVPIEGDRVFLSRTFISTLVI